jgi:hypothetical protein
VKFGFQLGFGREKKGMLWFAGSERRFEGEKQEK